MVSPRPGSAANSSRRCTSLVASWWRWRACHSGVWSMLVGGSAMALCSSLGTGLAAYRVGTWRTMEQLKRLLGAVDDFQQRHRWLAFPMAVVKKYGEDQGGQRAALLAYYGFFSLFPLLLVAVTVIGFVLHGRGGLGQRIVDSAVAQFPVIGHDISDNVSQSRLRGSGLWLTLSLMSWPITGNCATAESTILRRLRGLAWLVILGGGL